MTTRVNHTSRGNELRHRLISPTASARSDFKQLAKRGCVAELLQGRVAPISRFVSRGTSVTFHVDFNTRMHHVPRPDPVLYILVLRSRYTQPGRVSKGPVYIRTYTYIRGTNILGRTACEHANTAVGPIRFNSTRSLPLCLSFLPSSTVLLFFFFHPVSISDLHDPLTPWRTIDPRLTLLGVVSLSARPLSSLRSLRYSPLFSPLLLCSLMRGRDHLEYNFASFRIIIEFGFAFPFFPPSLPPLFLPNFSIFFIHPHPDFTFFRVIVDNNNRSSSLDGHR